MKAIRPVNKNLFCKQDEGVSQTSAGILLAKQEDADTAEVLAVGPNVENFKVGDHIVYKPYTTTEISVNGVEHFLIDEVDVLAGADV